MRAKLVMVTPEAIVELCKTRDEPVVTTCVEGLPEDATVVRIGVMDGDFGYARNRGGMEFGIIVQSEAFDDVEEGLLLQAIEPKFHTKSFTEQLRENLGCVRYAGDLPLEGEAEERRDKDG